MKYVVQVRGWVSTLPIVRAYALITLPVYIVVSLRPKIDRIQLWTRSKDDVERINAIGKKIVKLLDVANEPGIGFEFQVRILFCPMAWLVVG